MLIKCVIARITLIGISMVIVGKKQCELINKIEKDLNVRFGPTLGEKDLQKVLGYSSDKEYRIAVGEGTIPIPLFPLKDKRGLFALANDVAVWLVRQRYSTEDKDMS